MFNGSTARSDVTSVQKLIGYTANLYTNALVRWPICTKTNWLDGPFVQKLIG